MPLLSEAFIHVPMLLGKIYVERGIIKQSFFAHQSAYKKVLRLIRRCGATEFHRLSALKRRCRYSQRKQEFHPIDCPHMAGSHSPHALAVQEIERIIRRAGRDPVERSTIYNPIERAANVPQVSRTGSGSPQGGDLVSIRPASPSSDGAAPSQPAPQEAPAAQ